MNDKTKRTINLIQIMDSGLLWSFNIVENIWDSGSMQLNKIYNTDMVILRYCDVEMLCVVTLSVGGNVFFSI